MWERGKYLGPIFEYTGTNKSKVEELSKLFREDFRFEVEHTQLNNVKPPQQQLNAAISNFVLEHDDPNNLLVIYYAGHAFFNEKAMQLILAGSVYTTIMSCRVLMR